MALLVVGLKVVLSASSVLLCVLNICHQEKNELDEQNILDDYLQTISTSDGEYVFHDYK